MLVFCRLHRVRGLALGFGSWDPKDASASSEERQQRFNAVGLEADILVEVPHGCNNVLVHVATLSKSMAPALPNCTGLVHAPRHHHRQQRHHRWCSADLQDALHAQGQFLSVASRSGSASARLTSMANLRASPSRKQGPQANKRQRPSWPRGKTDRYRVCSSKKSHRIASNSLSLPLGSTALVAGGACCEMLAANAGC